jgi:hypothetical protein
VVRLRGPLGRAGLRFAIVAQVVQRIQFVFGRYAQRDKGPEEINPNRTRTFHHVHNELIDPGALELEK